MRPRIPDLRIGETEITLEHCSVLMERLKEILTGDDLTEFAYVVVDTDPSDMKLVFDEIFEITEFNRLFATDLGKGVLVGIYMFDLLIQFQGGQVEQSF